MGRKREKTEGEKEKPKEKKKNRSKESSREMGNLEWGGRNGEIRERG